MPAPITVPYVLALMFKIQPEAVPWSDTYEKTAEAVVEASNTNPLFTGEDGSAKSAALAVSVMWFESALKQTAEGDCDQKFPNGLCKPGGKPHSFCAFQIHESNFKELGITRQQIQSSIRDCVLTGFRMMKISFSVCRSSPSEKQLAHYAGGGNGCPVNDEANRKSKHRMTKALWLFKQVPVAA